MHLEAEDAGARRRHVHKTEIDLFVWHWTGAENPPSRLFRSLNGRSLGIEFAFDRNGVIYQFADPILTDTFDAGPFNRRSIGAEMINYGYRNKMPVKGKGEDRPIYTTKLRGRKRRFAAFYPEQIEAAVTFARFISQEVPTIPFQVPRAPSGGLLLDLASRDVRGHVGHFHLSRRKSDPGTDLLSALIEAGA